MGRIYANFPEALSEVKRDLKEMGILLTTQSVQNIVAPVNFYEVQNYQYTVSQPDWRQIPLKSPEWFEAEFRERTSRGVCNPGKAWEFRHELWEKFLNKFRKFDYFYPERMDMNLDRVINALKKDINTRRAFLPIIDIMNDDADDFEVRFPCSIGYHFLFRQGKLNITYLLRSSDFATHFNYDIALADRLKCFVAEKVGVEPGLFCHWIGSLHIFEGDVKGVF